MKFYICGPMRGIPDFNAPAFERFTDMLRSAGHEVVSPIELDREHGGVAEITDIDGTPTCSQEDFRRCMARDLAVIAKDCDALFVLEGWGASFGARVEMFVAMAMGLKLHFERPPSRELWCAAWKGLNLCGCTSYDRFVSS